MDSDESRTHMLAQTAMHSHHCKQCLHTLWPRPEMLKGVFSVFIEK